MKNAAASSFI